MESFFIAETLKYLYLLQRLARVLFPHTILQGDPISCTSVVDVRVCACSYDSDDDNLPMMGVDDENGQRDGDFFVFNTEVRPPLVEDGHAGLFGIHTLLHTPSNIFESFTLISILPYASAGASSASLDG